MLSYFRSSALLALPIVAFIFTGCSDPAGSYETVARDATNQLVADLPNIAFDEGIKLDVRKTDSLTTPYTATSSITGKFKYLSESAIYAALIEGFMNFTLTHSFQDNKWVPNKIICEVIAPRMIDYRSDKMSREEVEQRAMISWNVYSREPMDFRDTDDFKRNFPSYESLKPSE